MNPFLSKLIASGILGTILLGAVGWASSSIIDNRVEIAKLREENKSLLTHILDVKEEVREASSDIKILLQRRR